MNTLSRLPSWVAQHLVAARVVLALTLLLGLAYPLGMTAVAQVPGLRHAAQGSALGGPGKAADASSLIGQSFSDAKGDPLPQYFQPRPSDAGAAGYDPTSSGASNLGSESVVDHLSTGKNDPAVSSLLSTVCARSLAVGRLEHVSGARAFCTPDGVGAVLGVYRADGLTGTVQRAVSLNQACPEKPFLTTYQGVTVECAKPGEDYSGALVTPIRGDAPADPAVPADAVTASASGLDPDISPAYAHLQAARVARVRHLELATVLQLISTYTTGRTLGLLGEPVVDVVELNLALDRSYPLNGGASR
ncbi:potassium-transporting ATPase subunit C [Streptacidiphilus sp. MAP5-3]|uniref:potassium-transporting ATPase subunit C n=1 Tax=unclassified Streptacidiphilus TaxID=2643834 RepID=UPI00351903D0